MSATIRAFPTTPRQIDFTLSSNDFADALITWGDGATTPLTFTGGEASGGHAYAVDGSFTISIDLSNGGAPLLSFTRTAIIDTVGSGGVNVINGTAGDDIVLGGDDPGTIDILFLGDGDDVAYSGEGPSQLLGEAGNDTLSSFLGDSYLFGGTENDLIFAGEGNDSIDGEAGADTAHGGAGDDHIRIDSADDIVFELGGEGADTLYVDLASYALSDAPDAEIEGLVGNSSTGGQVLTGNSLNNSIDASAFNDTLAGGAGDDTIFGDQGDDLLISGAGVDDYAGAEGIDTLSFAHLGASSPVNVDLALNLVMNDGQGGLNEAVFEVENLIGGAGGDFLRGDELANHIAGNAGNDRLQGRLGNDTLSGGAGNDSLFGNADMLTPPAGDGDDSLHAGLGNDLLNGDAGRDILRGGAGADTMIGDAGNDTYFVEEASDVLTEDAGGGRDLVRSTVTWTLGDEFEDLLIGAKGERDGTGNAGNNIITGGEGANALRGLDGNDILRGGAGADTLVGGVGNDLLEGGAGDDLLLFDGLTGTDRVRDFLRAEDVLAFDAAVFTALGSDIEATEIAIGAAATTAAHRLVYNPLNGALLYDADGAGGSAAMQIAILLSRPALLDASDFQMV